MKNLSQPSSPNGLSRRTLLTALPVAGLLAQAGEAAAAAGSDSGFSFSGTFIDAAFTHPFGRVARAAAAAHVEARSREVTRVWPVVNQRNEAVAQFAKLINASKEAIAVVPSTMEGENLVGQALQLGARRGVITDALHYDASLVLYGEARKRGVPVSVVKPRGVIIDLDDIERAITPQTRLIAISLVSSTTGYLHDLKRLCDLAHSRGVLVYADIIQAAGAVPIDVQASGVDFCCAGTYKWLMGDFGTAFLYVRPDRLEMLRRVQVGWRQVADGPEEHFLPFQKPGPALGAYNMRPDTSGVFEVSSPAYGPLAIAAATIGDILSQGVENIATARQPLIDRLQEALPGLGFQPLTPRGPSPIAAFAYRDAAAKLRAPLRAADVKISLYEHRIRVSPSVYNSMGEIERLIEVLARAVRS